MTLVSSKHKIVLGMCFHAPPGVVGRSEFTTAVVIHRPLWKNAFVMCGLSL